MLETPVLFIIFNRPYETGLVFNEIRKQKPQKLYVFADGPRIGYSDDIERSRITREIIEKGIDWKCDLHTFFNSENLGCGKGPATAITWFFENVDEGIIIEDDCLPHPDFYNYCSELLDRYRYDERIMIIGATTYHDEYPCDYSYTFTSYGTMAAWATWKRVWARYDHTLSNFRREEIKQKLREHLYSRFERKTWLSLYDWIVKDRFSSYWDWQLQFIVFYNKGIAIRPKHNLISNIGTGSDASHTKYESAAAFKANRPVFGCMPLKHPPKIYVNRKDDAIYYKRMYEMTFIHKVYHQIHEFIFNGPLKNYMLTKNVLNFYRQLKRKLQSWIC